MILYHYTSLEHLQEILRDGIIKTTNSNLIRPRNLRIEKGSLISDTDHIKPVVWFTSELNFDMEGNGLAGSVMDKTAAAIAIDTAGPQLFPKWDEWAERNGIEKSWFDAMKKTGPNWRTWYISETPVKITSTTRIVFRPDVLQQLRG